MNKFTLTVIGFAMLTGHASPAADEGKFVMLPAKNPEYHGNELFFAFENYYSPRIRELRARYDLDRVVENEMEADSPPSSLDQLDNRDR
jgi:hypothetical protein